MQGHAPPSAATSGTTTSEPVKMHLSPGLAMSTTSWRSTTSNVRGIEPGGISLAFSWIRTLCQSTNLLKVRSNDHRV